MGKKYQKINLYTETIKNFKMRKQMLEADYKIKIPMTRFIQAISTKPVYLDEINLNTTAKKLARRSRKI